MNPKRSLPRRALPLLVPVTIASVLIARRAQPIPVAAASVERGTAIEAVYGTGTVEAEDRVEVKARVAGAVADVAVKLGQRVEKGDLLARIDAPAAAFDLERAEADLAAASAHAAPGAPLLAKLAAQRASLRADLDAARVELDRADKLGRAGVSATAEVDRARTRVLELEAQLAANEADERSLRIDLAAGAAQKRAVMRSFAARVKDTEVRAPIAGVVLARRVEPGEVVAVNQPLFKIGDVDRLILEVAVDEADVARVRDGSRGGASTAAAVSLYALPGRALRGHVFEVLPEANRDRKSFLVKVRLDAPEPALRSGMSAEVNLVAAERPGVLLVPSDALDRGAVWLIAEGRARRAEVKVGLRDLARVEVSGVTGLAGVTEGARVVIGDKSKLTEGARVAAAEPARAAATDAVKTAAR